MAEKESIVLKWRMPRAVSAAFFFVFLGGSLALQNLLADDFLFTSAGAPKAPTNAEEAKKDPFIALSPAQRHEIVREFRALLSMGRQEATAAHWGGNDIADCQNSGGAADTYCRKCDVQMGTSRADYFFYKNGAQCRLRDVEVTVDSGDTVLLKELKPQVRSYVESREGQFFLDEDEHSGQSSLRFVWKRPH